MDVHSYARAASDSRGLCPRVSFYYMYNPNSNTSREVVTFFQRYQNAKYEWTTGGRNPHGLHISRIYLDKEVEKKYTSDKKDICQYVCLMDILVKLFLYSEAKYSYQDWLDENKNRNVHIQSCT